jgi:hypothetical protein
MYVCTYIHNINVCMYGIFANFRRKIGVFLENQCYDPFSA